MNEYFRPPVRPKKSNEYPKYSLRTNPFKVDERLATWGEEDSEVAGFQRKVCAHEITRLLSIVEDEAFKPDPQSFWLVDNADVRDMLNNVVSGGMFAETVACKNPRLLPVYVAVPQATKSYIESTFRLTVDRLLPKYLRAVTYAFICRELEAAKREGRADDALPGVDINKFLEDMDKTEGKVLDDILFPNARELTEREEYGVMEEEDEEKIREEAETLEKEDTEVVEVVEEEEEGNELKDHLIYYIYERAQDPVLGFGEMLRSFIQVGMQEGFVKGRIYLDRAPNPREEIAGLFRFVHYYYNGIILFVDQLDPWRFFDDEEKLAFMSQVFELKLLAGDLAVTVFESDSEIYKNFDQRFVRDMVKLPLRLHFLSEDFEAIGKDEKKVKELIQEFLSLSSSKKSGLAPFKEDAVPVIMEKAGNNAKKIIDICGELLDKGKKAGYPDIDKTFVEKEI